MTEQIKPIQNQSQYSFTLHTTSAILFRAEQCFTGQKPQTHLILDLVTSSVMPY